MLRRPEVGCGCAAVSLSVSIRVIRGLKGRFLTADSADGADGERRWKGVALLEFCSSVKIRVIRGLKSRLLTADFADSADGRKNGNWGLDRSGVSYPRRSVSSVV
jgi:hypothetical protein